jgi:molybdenum transport protein
METNRLSAGLAACARPCCDDATLHALLREDAPYGDLTTEAFGLAGRPAEAAFHARGPMVVCGVEEAARLFQLCGAGTRIAIPSGSTADAGDLLLTADGDAPGLLLAWKTAQTLAEALSGIATAARRIVDALHDAGLDLPVACTRKNFPGTRALAAKAVRAGGAVMHRLGLSETLLVFPEHRAFIEPALQAGAIARLRRRQPEKRVVVEVGPADDALALTRAGADVLQLERHTPAQVQALRALLAAAGLHPLLAPAGGVTLANAVDYARAGADFLVTSAPYFAPPADIRVRLQPAPGDTPP